MKFLSRDEAAEALRQVQFSPQSAELRIMSAERNPAHCEEVSGVIVTCYPAAEYGTAADRFQVMPL